MRGRPSPDTAQAGFTLIEAVVALGVFSIAAMALLTFNGESIRAQIALEDAAYARIVADNQMVLALTDPASRTRGVETGTEEQAGRLWMWTRVVSPTTDPELFRIDVEVRLDGAERLAAAVTGFRGVS